RPFMLGIQKVNYSRGFLFAGHDAGDTLAVVEFGVPMDLLHRMGQVNLFCRLKSSLPGSEPCVSVVPIKDFSGIAMLIEPAVAGITTNGGGSTGVVYRPLASDDQIPSTWNSGQICFQATSAVGMSGASIIQEVDAADCMAMDTYCSPG